MSRCLCRCLCLCLCRCLCLCLCRSVCLCCCLCLLSSLCLFFFQARGTRDEVWSVPLAACGGGRRRSFCLSVCVCVCLFIIYIYIYTRICIYIYTHTVTFINICIYIYTYILIPAHFCKQSFFFQSGVSWASCAGACSLLAVRMCCVRSSGAGVCIAHTTSLGQLSWCLLVTGGADVVCQVQRSWCLHCTCYQRS